MPFCHCGKRALYNVLGQKAQFCSAHKTPDMMNVDKKRCAFKDCLTRPSFGVKGGKCQFCARHKADGMIDLLNDACEYDECSKQPIFNVKGEKKGRFCSDHKLDRMIDVKNKICEYDGCISRAHYDVMGGKGAFCAEHKKDNMINITNKTCESDGCDKQPSFNKKGEKKGRFCSEHALPEMVDVKNKICEYDGCMTRAHFDIANGKGKFCAEHKLVDMIDLTHVKCMYLNCDRRRQYNLKGQSARFCAEHKSQGMVDVRHKLCQLDECTLLAKYGFLGRDKLFCNIHKEKGMLIHPKQKCDNCKQLGTYDVNTNRYCESHAPPDATNLGIAKCNSCGLDDILVKGLCETCDPTIIQKRMKVKEMRVLAILESEGIPFIHNKTLEGRPCGNDKPDFQIDCGDHFVYLEVDEHQHRTYACECEQVRMINLIEVRGMPITFIRYNPDRYEPADGEQLKLEQREKKLVEWIRYAIKHNPMEVGAMANVLYLFYDGYHHSPEWHTLMAH
jgi:hypothetical protein